MSTESDTEICPICQDSLTGELYTLPECNHTFHTNCIMTWFRAPTGNSKCPLCNHSGINKLQHLKDADYYSKHSALINYSFMRKYSKNKNAPKELKKMVEKLKKVEERKKNHMEEFKNFKKTKYSDLTALEVYKKYTNFITKRWEIDRRIRRHKMLIGFQHKSRTLIIPIKENV